LREGGHKWIVNRDGTHALLFDLLTDPEETTNRALFAPANAPAAVVERYRRRCVPVSEASRPAELDPEVRAKLRALGYVDN
jgi:hypothetical protein